VKETLTELKAAGLTLGVVTGKRRPLALRGLRLFGLDTYMKAVVTPEDTTEHKPHPAPVLKALDLLGEDPHRTIMVGDSTLDLACARAAGTYTAAVSWSFAPLELLQAEKPDFILKRMSDLINICLTMGIRSKTI
ncbi:MAG: HAD-IA family hydrolase, partial [bacterium]